MGITKIQAECLRHFPAPLQRLSARKVLLRRRFKLFSLLVFVVSVFCNPVLAMDFGLRAPEFSLIQYDFNEPPPSPVSNDFVAINGAWILQGGTYEATTVQPTNLIILQHYPEIFVGPPEEGVAIENYNYRVRMRNQSGAEGTLVGLVYNYRDSNNYDEVVFSPTLSPNRMAFLRSVREGVVTTVATMKYAEGGPNLWFDVEVQRRDDHLTTVLVNHNVIFSKVEQPEISSRVIGLIAHNTAAQFDNFSVGLLIGTQPFKERFDGSTTTHFHPKSGSWTVANGVYKSSAGTASNISLTDIVLNSNQGNAFTASIRAKMFNPYGASGNTVGFVFNSGRMEVVFSNVGVAKVNQVNANGTKTNLATATIPTLKGQWFEVTLDFMDNPLRLNVRLNDKFVFRNLNFGRQFLDGNLGLVTNFSPGSFDNVEVSYTPFPVTYRQNFAAAPAGAAVRSGTWAATGGTYNSTAGGATDIVTLAPTGLVDFVYRAKIRNLGTDRGDLAGIITNYNVPPGSSPTDPAEYYEILFSATGDIIVNKIVQGTKVRQATGTYEIGSSPWIDVEIRRVGNSTSIRVNGMPKKSGILEGQVRGEFIGLVTHGTQANFDDVSWVETK